MRALRIWIVRCHTHTYTHIHIVCAYIHTHCGLSAHTYTYTHLAMRPYLSACGHTYTHIVDCLPYIHTHCGLSAHTHCGLSAHTHRHAAILVGMRRACFSIIRIWLFSIGMGRTYNSQIWSLVNSECRSAGCERLLYLCKHLVRKVLFS